jgi:uncharacterized protein (DUF885 family)
MKRIVVRLLGVVVLALAVFLVPTIWFQPWSADHFYSRVFIQYMLRHPMLITQIGLPLPFGADRLDDFSVEGERREAKFTDENLARLRRYDRTHMAPEARLSADVMDWFLKDDQENNRFMFYDYPVNQMFGFQSQLPDFMLTLQPLHSERDAKNYVARVARFGVAFDQTLEGLRLRESRGVMPPRFVLREVIAEMRRFSGGDPDKNPLYTRFAAETDTLKKLDRKQRDRLLVQLRDEIAHTVVPAYGRMLALLEHQESIATDDDGVWKLPNGDAYYAYMLRHHTTSDLTPDSVHALGVREVARLEATMRPMLAAHGFRASTLGDAMRLMRKDPKFGFPPGDSGRREIVARYQEILDDANRRCDKLFDVKPKAKLEVKRVPPFKEATAPGAYYNPGAVDGSRPGVFFANLRNPAETRRPDMRTLAYHEGIPGHHFQLTIAQELKGLPFFRNVLPFTAYAEGWALYAEHLALEQGFHRDVYDSLGALGAEVFRAVRLVVDTGIHRDHWTRQQAIDYMVAHTGMDTSEVVTEVERYIVMPGQACAYKVGQLEILALRQRAMDALGSRFDLRKFHDVVLTHGALPLTLLERVVDDWIDAEKRAGQSSVAG